MLYLHQEKNNLGYFFVTLVIFIFRIFTLKIKLNTISLKEIYMKKVLFFCGLVFILGVLTGCSDSKDYDNLILLAQEKSISNEFDSEIERMHYTALKNEFNNLVSSRNIDDYICYEENCEIYENIDDCLESIKSDRNIKLSLIPYIEKIYIYAEKESDVSSIRKYITKVENEAFGVLDKEDLDLLLQYGESFKAALKLGIEDCFDGQETSRNFFSDIWNVVNVAVSVAIGAVLGFGLGFLVSGSLVGAIPTAISGQTHYRFCNA